MIRLVPRRRLHDLGATTFLMRNRLTEEAKKRAQQVEAENQPRADLGNGFYQNPIMAGDYADPAIVRVGEDYYMAFSRRIGVMLWHSRDLVNWRPIIRHTFDDLDRIVATDLQYFDGKFHIYMPVGSWPGKAKELLPPNRANFVITSEKPEGPWSEPIRVDRDPIEDDRYVGGDPGFIQTPEGKKYLHTDVGFVMPLSEDGLRVTALPEQVYDGWEYPQDWIVETKGLESPKLFFKSGFYYLVSAMGGTGGPSTAHMAVVARSASPTGPWTDSPHNPLVFENSNSQPRQVWIGLKQRHSSFSRSIADERPPSFVSVGLSCLHVGDERDGHSRLPLRRIDRLRQLRSTPSRGYPLGLGNHEVESGSRHAPSGYVVVVRRGARAIWIHRIRAHAIEKNEPSPAHSVRRVYRYAAGRSPVAVVVDDSEPDGDVVVTDRLVCILTVEAGVGEPGGAFGFGGQ